MTKEKIIPALIVVAGVLLLAGGIFSYPPVPEFATAGAVLIGSWLVSRSIDKRNSS